MLVAGALQPQRDGAAAAIDIGTAHPQHAVSAVFVAPVADALPSTQQQGHDRAVTSRTLLHRDPFRHSRIQIARQQPRFAAAKLQPSPTRQVPAGHPVRRSRGPDRNRVLEPDPHSVAAPRIPLDQVPKERRDCGQPLVDRPSSASIDTTTSSRRELADIVTDHRARDIIQRSWMKPSPEVLHAEPIRPNRVAATAQHHQMLREGLDVVHPTAPLRSTDPPHHQVDS